MSTTPATISEAQAAVDRQSKTRIPFPPAGEDAVLHFNLKGIAALEAAAGQIVPDWMGRGFSPFGLIEKLLLDGHVGMVRAALDNGLKRVGDDGKLAPMAEIDLDEIDWPMGAVVKPALEIVAYLYTGEAYSELLAKMTAAQEAEAAERKKAREAV